MRRFIRTYWTNNLTLRVAVLLISGVIGFIIAGIGFQSSFYKSDGAMLADELKALPALHSVPRGQRGVIEGRVAADTPTLQDEFVAFQRTEYKCATPGLPRCSSSHVVVAQGKQPLTINTVNGPALIANKDYRFDQRADEWWDVSRVERQASLTNFTVTLRGLAHNSPVVAIGVVQDGGPDTTIRAEALMAGPRAELIEALETHDQRSMFWSPYLLLIGLLMMLYAGWEGRRVWFQ